MKMLLLSLSAILKRFRSINKYTNTYYYKDYREQILEDKIVNYFVLLTIKDLRILINI